MIYRLQNANLTDNNMIITIQNSMMLFYYINIIITLIFVMNQIVMVLHKQVHQNKNSI